jgi:hypothetical protein
MSDYPPGVLPPDPDVMWDAYLRIRARLDEGGLCCAEREDLLGALTAADHQPHGAERAMGEAA